MSEKKIESVYYEVRHNGVTDTYSSDEFGFRYPDIKDFMDKTKTLHTEMCNEVETVSATKKVVERIECQRCSQNNLVSVFSPTTGGAEFRHLHREHEGTVLGGMGIDDGGKYCLEFTFCTNCGQIQGEFPKRIHGRIITKRTDDYYAIT